MSFQLSAQAITAHTAITRMSVSRCSILPPQRGSLTASKWPTSRSIAMLRSPTFGEEDHPWLGNPPASGISCVAPALPGPLVAVGTLALIGTGYGLVSGSSAAAIGVYWGAAQYGRIA